jgi:hypothetical protein
MKFGRANYCHESYSKNRMRCLSPCTNMNSKWIKDLNIRPETLKLVQERAGNTLELIGIDRVPK